MIKKDNKKKGNYGENIAAKWLQKNGYHIIARNYSCRFGEIDIIAQDVETIVFTEVKYRRSVRYGTPGQAVTLQKQRHIIKTALFYLQENHVSDCDARFDIIEIVDQDGKIWIRHLESAFDMSRY